MNRGVILGSIPVGLGGLAMVLTGKQVAFMLCITVLCMVIVGVGAELASITTINERKEQTLAFVMSMPGFVAGIYDCQDPRQSHPLLIPLAAAYSRCAGCVAPPRAAHGLVPYTAIMALKMLNHHLAHSGCRHHHRIAGMDHGRDFLLEPRMIRSAHIGLLSPLALFTPSSNRICSESTRTVRGGCRRFPNSD